jgi:hypothetical protein
MATIKELEDQLETRKCVILYLVDLLGGEVIIPRDVYESLWQGYEYRTECNETEVIIQSRKVYNNNLSESNLEPADLAKDLWNETDIEGEW